MSIKALLTIGLLLSVAACGDDDDDDTADLAQGGRGGAAVSGTGGGQAGARAGGTGGAGGETATETACTLTIKLLDYKLDPKTVEADSGELTLCAQNDGQAPHDLGVRDGAGKTLGKTKTLGPGESDRFTVTLEAAEYAIYCTQAGHESLGMKGTLTVR